jgi:hypothetical protein
MVRRASILAGSLLLTLCGNAQISSAQVITTDFAGYTVAVTFSERAKKKLDETKESVIVANYFYGFPKPGTPRKYVSDMGEVGGLANDVDVEISPGETARIGRVKLKQDALARVDEKGAQVLINVFSGRKSSKNNLLACDIYEGSLKQISGTDKVIACKLIGE